MSKLLKMELFIKNLSPFIYFLNGNGIARFNNLTPITQQKWTITLKPGNFRENP